MQVAHKPIVWETLYLWGDSCREKMGDNVIKFGLRKIWKDLFKVLFENFQKDLKAMLRDFEHSLYAERTSELLNWENIIIKLITALTL